MGLNLAISVVFLKKQRRVFRPANGTVLKQSKATHNMIQLCWKNVSPCCAEAVGLAAEPIPSLITGGDGSPSVNRIPRTAPEVRFLQ